MQWYVHPRKKHCSTIVEHQLTCLQKIGWVVDFANMDKLDDRYYYLVRANQHDVYEPDSEGTIFLQLDTIFDKYAAQEHVQGRQPGTKQSRFEAFAQDELGQAISNAPRYYQILNDPVWRGEARKYCGYAFGRQAFKVYHFTLAAGQFMNEVRKCTIQQLFQLLIVSQFWIGHLSTQYNRVQMAFGQGIQKKLRIEDLKAVRVLDDPGGETHALRQLFFPAQADSKQGQSAVRGEWFVNAEFKKYVTFPNC